MGGRGRWHTVQSKDVSALVKALDKNGDGTVDTQELVQVLKVLVVLGVLGPASAHAKRERKLCSYLISYPASGSA